jgi:hypothetical protein
VVLSSGGDPHTALDDVEQVVLFESSSDSDDEEWDSDGPFAVTGPEILPYPIKGPIIWRRPFSTSSARPESDRITPKNTYASSVQSVRRLRAVFERWKHEACHESQAARAPQTAAVFQLHKSQST